MNVKNTNFLKQDLWNIENFEGFFFNTKLVKKLPIPIIFSNCQLILLVLGGVIAQNQIMPSNLLYINIC